jgi:hypothetical protein
VFGDDRAHLLCVARERGGVTDLDVVEQEVGGHRRAPLSAGSWRHDPLRLPEAIAALDPLERATATGALNVAGDPQAVKRLRKIFARDHMLAQAEATRDR